MAVPFLILIPFERRRRDFMSLLSRIPLLLSIPRIPIDQSVGISQTKIYVYILYIYVRTKVESSLDSHIFCATFHGKQHSHTTVATVKNSYHFQYILLFLSKILL